ncbi:hypothetical protein [Streptomyces collinus]|uniref:hypothetical protein n=1 Tax=Streptomyces collinus TaxID=42684 RepID=UPI00381374B7
MTDTTPAPAPIPSASDEDAQFEVMRADAVLTGRAMLSGAAMSSGEFWAGLVAAALVDTAGSPTRLAADVWPEVDPVVAQQMWDRACAVARRTVEFAQAPYLYRDRLERLQGELAEAGFHAMAGSVGRSVRLAVGAHPADGEIARER